MQTEVDTPHTHSTHTHTHGGGSVLCIIMQMRFDCENCATFAAAPTSRQHFQMPKNNTFA